MNDLQGLAYNELLISGYLEKDAHASDTFWWPGRWTILFLLKISRSSRTARIKTHPFCDAP